jgi:hypothetical protein
LSRFITRALLTASLLGRISQRRGADPLRWRPRRIGTRRNCPALRPSRDECRKECLAS